MATDTPGTPATPARSIAADLGEQYQKFHEFELLSLGTGDAAAQFAVVPASKTVQSLRPILDEFLPKPRRRVGKSTLRDVGSFVELTKRFASGDSAVFANPDRAQPSLVTVFDYHPKGDAPATADWLQHRATYAPPLSDEWKAWSGKNGVGMAQGDFAAFIEERATDLVVVNLDDPDNRLLKTLADLVEGAWANPTDMVRLSRGLQVNVESVVKNAQTLNSGEVSILYEETHKDGAGQPLKVPTLFTIAIPVFYAGQLYRLAARLRYRVGGGKITWFYQLVRPDLVFDDAFNGIVSTVRTETTLPVFIGSPEV
jgi:uncharacterized protein YfdQ (DUF2303 family)